MKKENLKLAVLSCSYCRNFTNSVLIVFAFIWSLADSSTFCQTGPKSQERDSVYQEVDKMPLFNEKEAGTFNGWVAKQIKYPEKAIKNKITGTVVTRFCIKKDGSVSYISVMKGVDPSLDAEAIRVIQSSPKWTPGMKNNVPVSVWMVVPIEFKLN